MRRGRASFECAGWFRRRPRQGGAGTHELDDLERTAKAHDVFSDAGGSRCADVVVDVESASNDGGVADATGEFVAETAGGTAADEVSIGTQDDEGDGVMAVGRGGAGRGLFLFPG